MAWEQVYCRPSAITILRSYNGDCSAEAVTAEALHNKFFWRSAGKLVERKSLNENVLIEMAVKSFGIELCLIL